MPAPTPTIELGDAYTCSLFNPAITSKFILCEGPRGTGKTRGILTAIMSKALRYPGSRWLLARSTRTRLSESVLTTLEEQVFPAFGMSVPGGAGVNNRPHYTLPNGSKLIPLGLDDQQRTQSVECAGIYVAEATELEQPNDVLALAGAMRQDVEPDSAGVDLVHQCIVDCNPSAPGHWLNKIAEPISPQLRRVESKSDYMRLLRHNATPAAAGAWKRVVTKIQDNVAYFDVINWCLKVLGANYLATLGYIGGFLKRRWIDGDWVAAEGAVFKNEFQDVRDGKPWHVIPPFAIPSHWPAFITVDPGYAHVLALLVGVVSEYGRKYVVGERVIAEKTIPEHAAWITKYQQDHAFIIRRKLGDPHDMFKKTLDGNGRSKAEQFSDYGHHFEPAPNARNNAEVSAQVDEIRTSLVTVLGDGEPELQFFDTCPMLITGMQSWAYKRNTKGQLAGTEDQFDEAYKDECDAVRMFIASHPTYSGPQFSVARR